MISTKNDNECPSIYKAYVSVDWYRNEEKVKDVSIFTHVSKVVTVEGAFCACAVVVCVWSGVMCVYVCMCVWLCGVWCGYASVNLRHQIAVLMRPVFPP